MNSYSTHATIKKDASWKAYHLLGAPEGGGGYVLPGQEFADVAQKCQAQLVRLLNLPVPEVADPLDATSKHFVWINVHDRLIAACRLVFLNPESLVAGHSYTGTLYNWPDQLPEPMAWPVAELSRLFVEPRSQTATPALLLLWRTIAELLKRPEMPRFWVGSLNSNDLPEDADQFLREWPEFGTEPTGIEAKYELPPQPAEPEPETADADQPATSRPNTFNTPAEMTRIGSIARSGISNLPPLWRLYYDMGARVLARGSDPLYPQATDALMVIDRQAVPSQWKRKLKFDYPLV